MEGWMDGEAMFKRFQNLQWKYSGYIGEKILNMELSAGGKEEVLREDSRM